MNRIEYIDQLKGLAIILVVMGHIADKSMLISMTPFNEFYHSINMPLFMFLSGIFAYKSFKDWNLNEAMNFLKKKALRILFPFFVIGGIYSLMFCGNLTDVYLGVNSGYWFLPALFYCMLFGLIVYMLINRIWKSNNLLWNLFVHGVFWMILIVLYYRGCLENIPYSLYAIKMYPFFVIGTFFSKYKSFKEKVLYSNNLFTISIIGYILCMIYQHDMPIKLNYIGFFSIIILINLFVNINQYIPKQLSYIGKKSAEIYIFHWFFLPSLESLGNWVSGQSIGVNQNFIILFCITFIIAIPIVCTCILLSKIIQNSNFLNAICFGTILK